MLFLHSHLCFERVGRAVRDPERIIISLKLVKDVVKAKPFAVLPGSGMSIEVTLERGDKVRRTNTHVVVYAPSHLLLPYFF